MATRIVSKRTTQEPPALKDFITGPQARKRKLKKSTASDNSISAACLAVQRKIPSSTALEDPLATDNEEGEEEGVLVLVVKEEPSDEQGTPSPPPDDVTTELDRSTYTHNYVINNDTASLVSLDLDDIREEIIEDTADERLTLAEYNGNQYDENSHLVVDIRQTYEQEEHVESAEDEDNAENQVRSLKRTKHTKRLTEEKYQIHNPHVDNFVLEKWLCGPQPDEKRLLKLMLQPPPPPPDPLPYVKCEDSNEFRCIYCAYCNRSECVTRRHYREKHGPRYNYCYACGKTFVQKVKLTEHEARRCNAPGIATVRSVRAALIQSDRWREKKNKSLSKSQRRKIAEPSEQKKSKRFKSAYKRYCQNRTLMKLEAKQKAKDKAKHKEKHTSATAPYVCNICDTRYWSLSYLKVHMEKKHGMMIITKKKLFNMLPTMSREEMEASEFITDLPSLLS